MSSIQTLNQHAEVVNRAVALSACINAAKGLYDVMKTNLGPKGTIKMLVGGAGDVKLTKDGNVLLREMSFTNPTARMIANIAVSQDDATGDGTTSTVLFVGELLKKAERYLEEGLHPRLITEGYSKAQKEILDYLEQIKVNVDIEDREPLLCVAQTALLTKLQSSIGLPLADVVTDAVQIIKKSSEDLDLNLVEIMTMKHKLAQDTQLIRGLVLDHGGRHPDMPKYSENCHILICNISLEFEKSEVNAGFYYSSAEQREKLVSAERELTDSKVRKIIEFKKKVVKNDESTFVVINQKGIDPISLDMLAREGILGLRRAKKRNMERLAAACGGYDINSVDELTPECLGFAGKIYEYVLGEEKYTFVEDVKNPRSCTILIKGPNDHTIAQIKNAVKDGLGAVRNLILDGNFIPGAGSFEIHAAHHLRKNVIPKTQGKSKLGVEAFAEALLGIPKVLAENSGFDPQDVIVTLMEEAENGNMYGLDVVTGDPTDPGQVGIYDNYNVKKQIIQSAPLLAQHLLLCDEIIRAGINTRKQ